MYWKVSAPVRGEELDGPGVHLDFGRPAWQLESDRNCHGRVTEIVKVLKALRFTIEI
jgi:hypothetical protein